jgi:very-short-patch-repair endonuclease/predicted transcriptional regulator of viral defense system
MHFDTAIARIAERQSGLITTHDLLTVGVTGNDSRYRVRTGRWKRIHNGVFLIGGVKLTPQVARWAAVLAAGQPAACSHATAASLWALNIPADNIHIHLLLPSPKMISLDGVVGHRTHAFYHDDLTRIAGLWVTTVERTIVDTAALISHRRLGQVIDAALRRKLLDLARLRRCVARLGAAPNRRTAPVHRALADRVPGYKPGDSDLESDVLRLIREWNLPIPVQNHRLMVGGIRFHLDLAWLDEKVTVELDSWEYHRGRQSFDDDRRRSNLLVAHGWTGFRFTPSMSHGEMRQLLASALDRRTV